ncbi:hypothetical protein AMK34_21740 [Amycolatopsis sp. CB00013]|nr:hypothetical protein AMK34_21740 [Amycolatopsis sp. CB00013]
MTIIGESYDGTAELPLGDIATRIREDLVAVQEDDMIHADAEFTVVADESDPQNQIHITVSGLPHSDHGTADNPSMDATRKSSIRHSHSPAAYNTFASSPYRLR